MVNYTNLVSSKNLYYNDNGMNGSVIEINAIHGTVILILLPFRRDEVSYQSCNCHSGHDWTLHRTTDNIFIFVSLVRLMESYIVLHMACNCNYR